MGCARKGLRGEREGGGKGRGGKGDKNVHSQSCINIQIKFR